VNVIHTVPDPLASRLKHLVVDLFRLGLSEPDRMDDHAPLFGGSLGLDSLDALSLSMSIEDEFGIVIGSAEESRQAFASIGSLARYVRARAQPDAVRSSLAAAPATPPAACCRANTILP